MVQRVKMTLYMQIFKQIHVNIYGFRSLYRYNSSYYLDILLISNELLMFDITSQVKVIAHILLIYNVKSIVILENMGYS